ncbi:MAG TPA: ferritin-like domain-containing protein [Rhizomicrobium sp.]|nr:ferritin-like domain-containing protein [Rhizomicrobium sp.]
MSQAFAIPPDLSRDTGTWPQPGPIRFGSDEHKRLFCKTLLDTFDPYRPAVLDWPRLDAEAEKRITALPIWDIAVQTENKAGMNVCTYAEGVSDPLLRKAIELNGFEERRHRHVLANLVEAYGVKLAPEPVPPRPKDPEWAFLVTGYSECIDSFFAFGLFKAAKDTGYFPPELVQTFDPVVNEEARHILFFVNWIAWHRRNMPWWRRPYFELKVLAVWIFLIYERIGIAKDVGHGEQDANFTVNGAEALGSDLNVGELVAVCLAENDRRLAPFDPRLKRPRFVPFMARMALTFIGPKKKKAA